VEERRNRKIDRKSEINLICCVDIHILSELASFSVREKIFLDQGKKSKENNKRMDYHKILKWLHDEHKVDKSENNTFTTHHVDVFFLAFLDLGSEGLDWDCLETWIETTFPHWKFTTDEFDIYHKCYIYLYDVTLTRIKLHQKIVSLNDMSNNAMNAVNENLVTEIDELNGKVNELEKTVTMMMMTTKKQKIEKSKSE